MESMDGWMSGFISGYYNFCQLQCPLALFPSCQFTLWSSQTAHRGESGAEITDEEQQIRWQESKHITTWALTVSQWQG